MFVEYSICSCFVFLLFLSPIIVSEFVTNFIFLWLVTSYVTLALLFVPLIGFLRMNKMKLFIIMTF